MGGDLKSLGRSYLASKQSKSWSLSTWAPQQLAIFSRTSRPSETSFFLHSQSRRRLSEVGTKRECFYHIQKVLGKCVPVLSAEEVFSLTLCSKFQIKIRESVSILPFDISSILLSSSGRRLGIVEE